ncbi:c-type cytochrome [Siminovitchia sp. FSL H7-0308]|uniref:Mono/diheme cytochrome c family protein n=1 Tax=Siminovitchia thermophila TaxID=1245522 RepID=A0ABS2R7Y5_9BACI|nr:c-type cytochrome [Siminovitchia thermophila]MBM7715765.1 mono/diheme cytochrome c family protein [Siminovitchia thermophila]ONK23574.1 cytochrome C [Bacillus sp. VT-16-64]
MNFPVVEFPWLGNGTVIAIIAIVHVIVSHGVAIGITTLMVSMEHRAIHTNNEQLESVARKCSKWVLIFTTTVGAMTGVGIWFSTTVIQPDSIGSLLRIFFWAWFVEWIVFVTEVVLLIIYYFTWDKWKGAKKVIHNRIGIALAIFSWITAAIITGILSAKLTPGRWTETLSFWNAFFNPTYMPSLAFRTFIAIILGVALLSFPIKIFIKNKELQQEIFRVFSFWTAISLPGLLITGIWYLQSIPQEAYDMIVWSTGMTKNTFTIMNVLGLAAFVIFAFWMVLRPKKLPLLLSLAIFGTSMAFIAEFEAVRESVRKPFIIYNYMYANGVLAKNEDLYREEGYLKHSTFSPVKEVTSDNRAQAGMELYKGQCMACHTVDGWREKRAFSNRLNGWDEESIASYIETLHETRPFMPPFVGTEEEKKALAHYLSKVTKKEPVTAVSEGK